MKKLILFLAANPHDEQLLRVTRELREIKEILSKSRNRDWTIRDEGAVRAADFLHALHASQPTIVHFSGHGAHDGSVFIEDDAGGGIAVRPEVLRDLFASETSIECVVLDACFSIAQAEAIASDVPYAIGTTGTIADDSAIAFSMGFYQGLTTGKKIDEAFKSGVDLIRLSGHLDNDKYDVRRRSARAEESTAVEEETSQIQKEAHVERRYNIVVMGKTGVGKSAMVNYLAGRPIVKVGVGKPVTKPGFHKREFDFHGIPARLFDSGGIELKNPEAWRKELRKELNMRSTDRPAEEWFHTIFYCVAASGARIEDFEIEAIEAFLRENYRVVIALTKADMVSRSTTKALAGVIAKAIGDEVPIVDVCSQRSERRDGTWEEPSGIDELRKVIADGFRISITGRLPDRCMKLLLRLVRRWQSEQRVYIKKHLTATNGPSVFVTLEQRRRKGIDDLSGRRAEQLLNDEVNRTLELYDVLAANIGTIDFKPMVRRRRRALNELVVPMFAQSGGRLKRLANEYLGWFDKELRDADSASPTRFVEDAGGSLHDSIEQWRPSIRRQIDRAAK